MSKWISVKDNLPKSEQLCVTLFAESNSGRVFLPSVLKVSEGLATWGHRVATHWVPLPELPEET